MELPQTTSEHKLAAEFEEPDGTCIPNADAWKNFTDVATPSNTRQPRIFVPYAGLEQAWEDWKGL